MCSVCLSLFIFFLKQKTAYELRISDWSSDVCSSDFVVVAARGAPRRTAIAASGECDAVRFIRRGVLRKHLSGRVVERRRRSDEAHGVVAVAGRADVVYPPVVGIAAESARDRLIETHRSPPKREPHSRSDT